MRRTEHKKRYLEKFALLLVKLGTLVFFLNHICNNFRKDCRSSDVNFSWGVYTGTTCLICLLFEVLFSFFFGWKEGEFDI